MSLEDLIAAERATPAEPSTTEAKAIWKRIRNGTGAAVPPAFDVSPATTVVTLKMKISAAVSTTIGKAVVGTAVVGTLAGGTAAVVNVGAGREEAGVSARGDVRGRDQDESRALEKKVAKQKPVAAPVAERAPVIEAEPNNVPAPAPEVAVEPEVAPAKSKPRAKPSPSTFADEFALIKQAQRAVAKGDANAALAALASHERKFPNGSMNEDRFALRALALCKAGRRDEGRRAASALAQRFPRSLYLDRVNEACR